MKFRIRFAEQVVGFFILTALLFTAAVLILMGINQRWFAQDYYFYSRFSSAKGISPGMSMQYKGLKVGTVEKVFLDANNDVQVNIKVYSEYIQQVTQNSIIELISNPLGLGGGLMLYPGKTPGETKTEPVLLNSLPGNLHRTFIPSVGSSEADELVRQELVLLPDEGDAINDLLAGVDRVLENINVVLLDIDGVIKGTQSGPLTDTIVDADELIKDLDGSIASTLGKVNDALRDIKTISSNLAELSSGMDSPQGLVTTLLDPKGSLATLLDDEGVLLADIQGVIDNLNNTVDQLKQFSVFLNSEAPQISSVIEESRETLDKGQDVLEGLSNNPLLRGGIEEEKIQDTTIGGFRDEDF